MKIRPSKWRDSMPAQPFFSRRQLLRKCSGISVASAVTMIASPAVAHGLTSPDERKLRVEYQGTAPSMFITELDDSRLLATIQGRFGAISEDGGKNWSAPFPYLQEGKPFQGPAISGGDNVRLLRLNNSHLGMLYCR